MSGESAWRRRLKSRWRKFRRDPAAFADDLPSPPLRWAALRALLAVSMAEDLIAGARRERRAWRKAGVALRLVRPEAAEYQLLTEAGAPAPPGPRRILLSGAGIEAIAVAFRADGGVTAAEIGAGRLGVLDAGGQALLARLYRLDDGGPLPARIEAAPLGRGALIARLRRQGLALGEALRIGWPPGERRFSGPSRAAYREWIARNEPGRAELEALARSLAGRAGPTISVVMPVHDPRPEHLQAAIASVRAQAWPHWRLCIADDGSRSAEVRSLLQDAARDPRVRLARLDPGEGVAAATNAALALAEGEIAAFLDHDDELAPNALAEVAQAFAEHPEAAAVYSDEDVIDAEGRRADPVFKPDLDRERLLAQNYVNHLFAARLELVRRLGGVRRGIDGSQDHDLVLRVVEADAGPVLHLPKVLYHWRVFPGGSNLSQQSKAPVDAARLKAVQEHLARIGERAGLEPGPRGHLIVRRAQPEPLPEVAAIVPTRDRPGLLQACVTGLLDQTDYPRLKVWIVDNGSRTPEALALLARLAADPRVEVLRIDAPFNFSALNNAAARRTAAPMLAFVNDDVIVIEPGWLKALVALAARPDVGAAGAKLYYPDGRIQHAGIVLGVGPQRVAGHEFRGAPGDSSGPQNRLLLAREVSAVTAACMAVERRKFEAVGGLDEAGLAVAFNDVDLCLKLRAAGWRNIWTPQARLMHLESATRGSDRSPDAAARFAAEVRCMHTRWGDQLQADPFYNPNLTRDDEGFGLAARPGG